MWQFFSDLPVWVWGALIGLLFFVALMVFGGAAVAAVIAVIRGGKIKFTKAGAGVEIDAPEDGQK